MEYQKEFNSSFESENNNIDINNITMNMAQTLNFRLHAEQFSIPMLQNFKIEEAQDPQIVFNATDGMFIQQLVSDGTMRMNETLEQRIDLATEHENELEEIIDEIWMTDKKEMNETKKKALVAKIAGMQLYSLKELAVAIGTMYDKRALAKGESTSNTDINIKMDKKVEELSQ